jgi:phosphonate transport system substrate-binding protein
MWVALLLLGVALGSLTVGLPAVSQQGTLVPAELQIGMIPSRAAGVLQPPVEGLSKLLLDYLQKNGFPEIKTVKAVIPESYTATVEALGAGRLHVGLMGPSTTSQAMERYGAIPIIATKRGESLRYRGQFMTHFQSPFGNLPDVVEAVKAGTALKFSYGGGSTSSSGFLFPCKTLKDLGILPGDNKNLKTVRPAGGHLGSAIAVYKKDVDFGIGFEDVRTSLNSDSVKKELGWQAGQPDPSTRVIILGYTDWIPNDTTVAIKELKPELIKAIKEGFVAIVKTDDGKKFAATALDATDFVRVPEDFDAITLLKTKVKPVALEIEARLAACENQ